MSFGNMFSFLGDMNNYEERKIDKYEQGDLFISTQHPLYNDGQMVIVEHYDTVEEAQAGHKKWVGVMTAENLPSALEDCCNAGIAQLMKSEGETIIYEKGKE